MGSIVLVVRLVLADVRRYPSQVAMLLFAVTTATVTLALGLSLSGTSRTLYEQTRAATAGPDVVALSGETGPAVTPALAELADAPEVVAHHGPYRIVYADLTTRDTTASPVVVHGFAEKPGALNRPLVTSGQWVRSGGTVLERGFATALGVGVGDHVTIAGRSYPVVGIAVTAATSIYPWAQQIGPYGGGSDYSGLAWMTRSDARSLASSHDLPVTTAMDLKLRDPAATESFRHAHRGSDVRINFHSWQFAAEQDAVILRGAQPILVLGSWLLSFLAVTGVAALAAGRAVQRTRRAGLLKAVGATPGLIAAVLLTEYLDMMWHTILGIETTIDIFFSPSHLGLVVTMMLIITTPLRSAWNATHLGARPRSPACCLRCSGSRSPPRWCRCSCRTATPRSTAPRASSGRCPCCRTRAAPRGAPPAWRWGRAPSRWPWRGSSPTSSCSARSCSCCAAGCCRSAR
ncbi:MAG: hypothetical protein K0R62_4497 [Nonomuraea muscovyensis]|nr:hypothetical protein [Nonomuraea muscovyensis]